MSNPIDVNNDKDNYCDNKRDNLKASCSVVFSGNLAPIVVWRRSTDGSNIEQQKNFDKRIDNTKSSVTGVVTTDTIPFSDTLTCEVAMPENMISHQLYQIASEVETQCEVRVNGESSFCIYYVIFDQLSMN